MLRAALDKRLICVSMFPFNFWPDVNSNPEKPKELTKMRVALDKIKDAMFDKQGNSTKEFQSVRNVTVTGTIVGFFLGGTAKAKDIPANYRAENQARLYHHAIVAQREIQTSVSKAFITGGLKYALKLGTFTFLFSSIETGLYVYRAKFDLLNAMCAGAVSGLLYKVNMGLRGMFAGSFVGAVLGTMYGSVTAFVLLVTGATMDDLYSATNPVIEDRQKLMKGRVTAQMKEEQMKAEKLREESKKEKDKESKNV